MKFSYTLQDKSTIKLTKILNKRKWPSLQYLNGSSWKRNKEVYDLQICIGGVGFVSQSRGPTRPDSTITLSKDELEEVHKGVVNHKLTVDHNLH